MDLPSKEGKPVGAVARASNPSPGAVTSRRVDGIERVRERWVGGIARGDLPRAPLGPTERSAIDDAPSHLSEPRGGLAQGAAVEAWRPEEDVG